MAGRLTRESILMKRKRTCPIKSEPPKGWYVKEFQGVVIVNARIFWPWYKKLFWKIKMSPRRVLNWVLIKTGLRKPPKCVPIVR